MRRVLGLLLGLTGVGVGLGSAPAPVLAAPADGGEADAAELGALGKAAYTKKLYDDAVAAFEAAYQADPDPKYLFNLARCHEKRGDLARAARYFERYIAAAPKAVDRRKVKALAKMLRVKLKKAFTRVKVRSEPDGAFVRVDLERGEAVEGAAPWTEWLPFGTHRLTVSRDGHEPVWRPLTVKPGDPIEVLVELKPESAPEPKPKPEPEPEASAQPEPAQAAPAEPPAASAGWLPWTTVGVGALLLGGGVLAGVLSRQAEEERDDLLADAIDLTSRVTYPDYAELDDDARTRALTANVLLGVGTAAVIAGTILVLTSGGEEVAVVPLASPDGPGVALAWRASL